MALALLTVVTLPAHEGKDERTYGLYRKVRVLTPAQVKALGYLPTDAELAGSYAARLWAEVRE